MSADCETHTELTPQTVPSTYTTHSDMYSGEVGDGIYRIVPGYTESNHIAPYDRPLPPSLFPITEIHPHVKTKPFRQCIQLAGPSQYPVRATAQVDDGAMRNCIGLHVWHSYGHCLGTLMPTTLRVSVANSNTIPCAGLWSGEVKIRGTSSFTHFVVFECGGAFDVILGKPWLHEVNAIHDYRTDTITISTNTSQTTIENEEHTTDTTVDVAPTASTTTQTVEPSLDDQLQAEILRINTLRNTHGPFAETRWAKYLDVEEMDDEDDTAPEERSKAVEWFTTRAEQRAIE